MANILVVGAGVVGTATGNGFAKHDNKVTFADVDPGARERAAAFGFAAVEPDEIDLTDTDIVFVAVSAPTGADGIDLSHLVAASRSLGAALQRTPVSPLVVYRCTTPPGTTRRLTAALEDVSGMRAGTGFAVAYNPEYLRAATAFDDFLRPPMVTVGLFENDQKTAETLHRLYRPFGAPISFLGVEEAEFQKYVHNLFNATKISFFNEMRGIAHGCGLTRVDELFQITAVTAEGLRNPRYGIDDRGPYGGGCLPKDVSAWLAEMERLGIESPMASAARTVNIRMGGR